MSTVSRRRVWSEVAAAAIVGFMLGAIVAPVGAGGGDEMILGEKNNSVRATKLISRGGLHLIVGRAGKPALTIQVKGNTAPMVVNSSHQVDNLNADFLDGKDADDFAGSDEGLMGEYYQLAKDTWVTVFSEGPWDVSLHCIYSSGGSPVPPSVGLTLKVEANGEVGNLEYWVGAGAFQRRLQPGSSLESIGLARSYGTGGDNEADIGRISLVGISAAGTRMRIEGVGWADADGCYAAVQVVPWPTLELGPPTQ